MTDIAADIFAQLSEQLRLTPQPKHWHGEGDVYIHTLMVCNALESLPEYRSLPENRRELLMAAARLHDIGKIPATKEISGQIKAIWSYY